MKDILSIITKGHSAYKNPEDITDKELNALQLEIEESIQHVNKLQSVYRGLTGRNYVPNIRL